MVSVYFGDICVKEQHLQHDRNIPSSNRIITSTRYASTCQRTGLVAMILMENLSMI
jgi:hypothetical protein